MTLLMSGLRLYMECNFVRQLVFKQVSEWQADAVTTNMKILILTFSIPPIWTIQSRYSVANPS